MGGISVVLRISGAYCALLIGSGFATGQEILQFFAGYGLPGVAGCLIYLLAAAYLAVSLLHAGQRHALHNSDEVFRHYAGPVIGPVFGWYTVVVAYSVYVVMLAGAGAVLHEYLGTPVWAGAAAMALAVFLTLYFGLHELVDVIGSIGPLLIVLIVMITATALIENPGSVARGAAVAGSLEMPRAASNWWMSALVYTAMCHTALAAFLPPLGAATADRPNLTWAGILGPLFYTATLALCVLALLGGMPGIETRMIPMLELAQGATPRLAMVFSWIVLAGIFTTAAPMLWITIVRFAADGSPRYRVLAAALAAAGLVIAIALPFDRLLNLIYPTVGWSGMLLIGFILAKQLRSRSIA
jgi:uncharacterized membrane protein YkvI